MRMKTTLRSRRFEWQNVELNEPFQSGTHGGAERVGVRISGRHHTFAVRADIAVPDQWELLCFDASNRVDGIANHQDVGLAFWK